MLELSAITAHYGKNQVLRSIDLKVAAGEVVALIGANAADRAETRMWVRRVEWKIIQPMTDGFRFSEGLPLFKSRVHCVPEAAPGLKAIAQDGLKWLDGQLAGRRAAYPESLQLRHRGPDHDPGGAHHRRRHADLGRLCRHLPQQRPGPPEPAQRRRPALLV